MWPRPPASITCPCLGMLAVRGYQPLCCCYSRWTQVSHVSHGSTLRTSQLSSGQLEQSMTRARPPRSLPCHLHCQVQLVAWSLAPQGAAVPRRHESRFITIKEQHLTKSISVMFCWSLQVGRAVAHQQGNADLCCLKPKLLKTTCNSTSS